jgi:hypothetical protein
MSQEETMEVSESVHPYGIRSLALARTGSRRFSIFNLNRLESDSARTNSCFGLSIP